jgi:lysophospholipase L1-like esterase
MIERVTGALSYAALGSSFAAGPGIEPIVDVSAMRSGNNYPRQLARLLQADLTDLTVSGATTATILHQPQTTVWGTEFPPQLDGLPDPVDLVTVTAGGNDLQYMAAMLFTAWNRVDPGGPMATLIGAELADALRAPSPALVERTAAGLTQIVTRIRARAPRARVLLVDYLTIIGPTTEPAPGVPFDTGEIDTFRAIQTALETAYQAAAEHSRAELVRVSAISRDHALGSPHPWIFPFAPDPAAAGSFHPNAAGMAAVAAAVAAALA